MAHNLTDSLRDRQNILNNRYALSKAEEHLALGGVAFREEQVFTKQQVADLLEVSDSTIERYLTSHEDELKRNGYHVLKGKSLKEFKVLVDVSLASEGNKVAIVAKFDELMALCDRLKVDLTTSRQHQTTLTDTLIEAALEAA